MASEPNPVPFIPPKFTGADKTILLSLPPPQDSPTGSMLQPQLSVIEYALKTFTPALIYHINMEKARGSDPEGEKQRFQQKVDLIKPSLIMTSTGSVGLVNQWISPDIPMTSFGIGIANQQTAGKLEEYNRGLEALKNLKAGDKILICEPAKEESVNDDVGSVKLPNQIKKRFPGVEFDWSYGTSYREKNLSEFALALHCGIGHFTQQQMAERVHELLEKGVPVLNFGLVVLFINSPELIDKVLEPWKP